MFLPFSVDGTPSGGSIKFGQPFAITTLDGSVLQFKILIENKPIVDKKMNSLSVFCTVIQYHMITRLADLVCK